MSKAMGFLSLFAAILFVSPAAFACWSDTAVTNSWGDLNGDLNDLGMIFMDSHPNNNCGPTAATRLLWKLQARQATNSNTWLAGASPSPAFAAALQLGPRGLITPELDAELARLAKDYSAPAGNPTLCGFD